MGDRGDPEGDLYPPDRNKIVDHQPYKAERVEESLGLHGFQENFQDTSMYDIPLSYWNLQSIKSKQKQSQ